MNTLHPTRGGTGEAGSPAPAAATRVLKLLGLLSALLSLSGPAVRVALPAAAVAVVAASTPAQAYDKRLGTLTSTGTSVNQTTTGTPFTLTGNYLSIQCDAAACVNVGSGSSTTASCAVGQSKVQLSALQLYDIQMPSTGANAVTAIAVISVSGTVNCDVYQVVTGP
jgi:hypothetical protein